VRLPPILIAALLLAPWSARADTPSVVRLVSEGEGVEERVLRAALTSRTPDQLGAALADAAWLAERPEAVARRAAWWSASRRVEEAGRLRRPDLQAQAQRLLERVAALPEVSSSCLPRLLRAVEALTRNDLQAFEAAYAAAAQAEPSDFERERIGCGRAFLVEHGFAAEETERLLPYFGDAAVEPRTLSGCLRLTAGALALAEVRWRCGAEQRARTLLDQVEAVGARLFPGTLQLRSMSHPEALCIKLRLITEPNMPAARLGKLLGAVETSELARAGPPVMQRMWRRW
jgi:hypothetical protein